MASKQNNPQSHDNDSSRKPEATVLERVQELTWALLDEGISDDEMSLLDTLLLSDDKARECYIECVQLHTDLMGHFAASNQPAGASSNSKSPILSFLNADLSSLDLPAPRTAD